MDKYEDSKEASVVDITGDMLRAAAYSTLQMPMEGVAQLVGGKAPQLIDAPKAAEAGSELWMAQHMGSFIGAGLLTAGVHKITGTAFGAAGRGTFTQELLHAGATGAVMGGLLVPTDPGSGHNLFVERGANAMFGAAQFGIGAAFAYGVKSRAANMNDGYFKRAFTSEDNYINMAKSMGGAQTAVRWDEIMKAAEKK